MRRKPKGSMFTSAATTRSTLRVLAARVSHCRVSGPIRLNNPETPALRAVEAALVTLL